MKVRMIITLLTVIYYMIPIHMIGADPSKDQHSIEIVSLNKVPIVVFTLNGKTGYFVLDSGSDVSLVHAPGAVNYHFTFSNRATKSMIGVSGKRQPLYPAAEVNLHLNQRPLKTDFYATDLSLVVESLIQSTGYAICGIIGMNIMRKYGFEIDYASRQLVLHLPAQPE